MAPVEPGSAESLYRTLAIAQSGIMILTLIITLIVRTTLKKASWDQKDSTLSTKIDQMEKSVGEKIAAVHARLDRAGEKTSDLASDVQGLPERLRQQFVGRETMTLFVEESRVERSVLRQDIGDLRDRVDNLIRPTKN